MALFAAMKQMIARVVMVILLLLSMAIPQNAASPAVYTRSGVTGVRDRSAEYLRRAWEAIPVPSRRFDEWPSTANPYRLGRLSGEFLQQNLDTLNFFRLAAGLSAVGYTDADNTDAQYGALLLAATDTLAHNPPRPAGMSDDFYRRGCAAANAGNIAAVQLGGWDAESVEQNKLRSAVPMIMRNYVDGFGSVSRADMPHRRWILYPALQSVGFGCADGADSTMYQVLKVIDTQGSGTAQPDYDFIAWPASGSFPVQAITPDVPWSISLNPERFQTPKREKLSVSVTRLSDGATWTLDASSSANSQSGSFLLVDIQQYGVSNCILFAFSSGETGAYSGDYRVTVSGIATRDGREAVLDYTLHFVDLAGCTHDWSPWRVVISPTCSESGLESRVCRDCAELEEQTLPPLGHAWEVSRVLEASGKYRNGTALYACAECGEQKTDVLPLAVCQDGDCPCARFSDAPERENWAHNGIDFVVENGIFNGTGENSFSPKGKMTRAMLVTVLWRIAGKPEAKKDCTFTDVDRSAYYAPAVRWASENGVVQGYSAQRFGPSDNVTREQAVTLLQRFFAPEAEGAGGMEGFQDAEQVHDYARTAMRWAIDNRVITGQADAAGALYLLPDNSITREQTASVIMRCMMNLD